MNETLLTLHEAAKEGKVTRQAIYAAIRLKKLPARKVGSKWYVCPKDLETYRVNKYDRSNRKIDGELVFDPKKGECTVHEAAAIIHRELHIPYSPQNVYYMLRCGILRGYRKGAAWIVKIEDLNDYLQRVHNHKKKFA